MADNGNRNGGHTRIQLEKRKAILDGALEVFSRHGYRGSTIDRIAAEVKISKPNLLYYFPSKDAIYTELLTELLGSWLSPLRDLDPNGEPIDEILRYVRRKLDMAQTYPRESRLFANEIIQGAPHISGILGGQLKELVGRECAILQGWMDQGRIARIDPHHLIFSIWATTQHYADFDIQVRAVLGARAEDRFDQAACFLETLYRRALTPER